MLRFSCPPTRGFIARSCAKFAPTSSAIVASSWSTSSVSWPRPSLNDATNKFADEQSNKNNINNIQNNFNTLLHHHQSSSLVVRAIASNDIMPLCPALVTHPRFFATSSTPSSPAPNNDVKNNGVSNYLEDVKNAAFRLWFNEELIHHIIRKLQNSNNNDNNILTSTFTSLHQKFHDEAGQNYSSLLEEMNANNSNTSNELLLDKLYGGILDKVVLEQMISWQNNNNNIAASNEPLLLGTLCFLNAFAKAKPQLLEPKIAAESVSETIPYKDFDILCSRLHVDFTHKRVANEFTSLMNSAITKYNESEQRQKISVSIATRIKQRHDELKQHHAEIVRRFKEKQQERTNNNNNKDQNSTASTTNATDSAQVVAQARLLESANCYFSCSWSALATCTKRFTDAPVALRDQFVLVNDYSAAIPQTNTTPYFSERVNIVAGPSGSGKTISSLLAKCSADPSAPIFNILVHVGIDCCVAADVPREKGKRNLETKRELLRGILCSLVLRSSDEVAELLPNTDSENEMWDNFREILRSSLLQVSRNEVTRVVVDEIGKRPLLLRGLISVWNQIRSMLADVFATGSNRLELFVVGTGTECFQMSPPGSMPTDYHLFTINRDKVMFKQLFDIFRKNELTKSGLAEALFTLLVTEADSQTDPIIKAIIRMSSNARCGAIILSFINETASYCRAVLNREVDGNIWTFDQVRSVVAGWCPLIAAAFASKNGLGVFGGKTNRLKSALGRAMSFALNRDRQLVELPDSLGDSNDDAKLPKFLAAVSEEKFRDQSNEVWEQYGVRFGLLYDTARRIRKNDYCGKTKEHYDVVYGVDGENNNSVNSVEYYYIVKKGQPRFMIDEAFVTMFLFLTQSTSTGVFSVSHPSTDLLFEEANWDFARVAAQFGKRVSVDEIVASLDEKCFTPPHLLYGLGVKKVYSMHLNARLEETAFENALPQELSKGAEFWRKAIQDEDAACVLLNGDSAEGADMIVLSRNRIVMTQCKNTWRMKRQQVRKELHNMSHCSRLLEQLCSIVADPKHADESIEVFYVIAGTEANSFTCDAFDGMRTEMPALANDPIKSHYNLRETLHATQAGMSSDYSVPHFYPILQSALPRRNEQQFGRTMIRSCINGENLETSTVHF